MRLKRLFTVALVGVLCLAAASCNKGEIATFGGQMDQFTATDADGNKTYLGHAEEWIYWEAADNIKIYDGSNAAKCNLISGAGALTAFFKSESPVNTDGDVWAIYPYSSGGNSYTQLTFPADQPYRPAGSGTHPDSSFGIGAMPMVAYDGAAMREHGTIYFHVVAGILRLQFYSSSNTNIQEITFEEVSDTPKQISGSFTVNDIDQNMPYLTATDAATEANRKITISGIDKQIGPSGLLTFYLPLPALGASTKTNYKLKVTVQNGEGNYFVKTLGADIHRRNITMMPALEITDWVGSPDAFGSEANIQLVGSGTKDRPFQIYTAAELKMVRDAFTAAGPSGTVRVNGQTVVAVPASGVTDNATHFKIVRSDIRLVNSSKYATLSEQAKSTSVVWPGGIPHFKGYMYFASSTATNGGITNESNYPLFESIDEGGVVNRVYVKGNSSPTLADNASFSPMCNVNNGTMVECHNKCAVTLANNVNLAGLCVTNNGSIIGGANEAALTTAGNVSGICFNNNGYIQGNFTLSAAVPQGANIAGIAYNNNSGAQVVDCQVSSSIPVNSTGNWGIVVFDNKNGALVDNCRSTGTVVFTVDGSVGGICNHNGGTVKNCTNRVELRASQGNVGGIAATMDDAAAEIYNCCSTTPFIYGAVNLVAADNCGGLVGELLKGKLYNCYNASSVTGAINSGGAIGYLANDDDVDVENCWSAQGHGFVGLYEDGAHVDIFCFSATHSTTWCNLIYSVRSAPTSSQAYEIFTMRNTAEQLWDGAPAPSTYIGKHCGEAMNDWVASRPAQGDSRTYYNWTHTAGSRPTFITGMPGENK